MSTKGRRIPHDTPELIAAVRDAYVSGLAIRPAAALVGVGQARFYRLLAQAGVRPRERVERDEAHRPGFRNPQAYCRASDPDTFFPDTIAGRAAAADICRSHCLVMEGCLRYALQVEEEFGVWGGCTELERDRISSMWDETSPLVVECESCERGFVPLIDGDSAWCAGCRKKADARRIA